MGRTISNFILFCARILHVKFIPRREKAEKNIASTKKGNDSNKTGTLVCRAHKTPPRYLGDTPCCLGFGLSLGFGNAEESSPTSFVKSSASVAKRWKMRPLKLRLNILKALMTYCRDYHLIRDIF